MAKSNPKTSGQYFNAVAVHGGFAWIIYAIVECFFASIFTWITMPSIHYKPMHCGFTALLFIVYPLFGIAVLAMLTMFLKSLFRKLQPSIFLPSVAAITIVLAFDLNLIRQFLTRSSMTIVATWLISSLIIFGLILRASSLKWYEKLKPILNSWTISMIMIGLLWITQELIVNSKVEKIATFVIYPVFICLISIIANWLFNSFKTNRSTPPRLRKLSYVVTGALVILGLVSVLDQSPYQASIPIDPLIMNKNHPNVILITLDTARGDHLSLYGYERDTTPNLRELSNEATLFKKAVSSSDITLSSHASIFTSLYASEHGAHFGLQYPNGHLLNDSFNTLAEILSDEGYLTRGVVANFGGIGYQYNLNQGFQFFDIRFPVSFLASTNFYFLRSAIRLLLTNFFPSSQYDKVFRNAEEINREVFNQLEKFSKNKKSFFLFINYMDAHWPYIPPHPYDQLYQGKNESINSSYYYKLREGVSRLKRKVSNEEHDRLVSQYDGALNYLDAQIGEFVGRLRDLGFYDNTLIIITSDHGEVFGRRDLLGHGVSVYQDQIYVPLLIKYPFVREKEVISQIVSGIDIMPTILDVLGYEISQNLEGKSLRRLKENQSRYIISESYADGNLAHLHPRFQRIEQAIFYENYKLLVSTSGNGELYDLSMDPFEINNIYDSENTMAKNLLAMLGNWQKTKLNEPEPSENNKLDKVARENLKSLGYIK